MFRILVFTMVSFGLVGCLLLLPPPIPMQPSPNVTNADFRELVERASDELGCPVVNLSHEYLGQILVRGWRHRITGCGQSRAYVRWCFDCIWVGSVDEQAAFDMRCPIEQLSMRPLGENVVGVSGCGQQMSYLLVYPGNWVANVESRAD